LTHDLIVQNFIKLSAAVRELSSEASKQTNKKLSDDVGNIVATIPRTVIMSCSV